MGNMTKVGYLIKLKINLIPPPLKMLHGGLVVGHGGAYEHKHGHTSIWQVSKGIWLHGTLWLGWEL